MISGCPKGCSACLLPVVVRVEGSRELRCGGSVYLIGEELGRVKGGLKLIRPLAVCITHRS